MLLTTGTVVQPFPKAPLLLFVKKINKEKTRFAAAPLTLVDTHAAFLTAIQFRQYYQDNSPAPKPAQRATGHG